MNSPAKKWLLFIACLVCVTGARGQSPQYLPQPPNVIVEGNVLWGSSYGVYSTNNYGGNGVNATLTISPGGAVSMTRGIEGYWTEPYLISDAYDVPGYYVDGYWYGGYWVDGHWSDGSLDGGHYEYYDGAGVWVPTATWVDPVWYDGNWVEGYYVGGYHVDAVWAPAQWITSETMATGLYSRFTFELTGGYSAVPADPTGTPWITSPKSGIPAVQVQNKLFQFKSADNNRAYDYYLPPSGAGYLWVSAGYYGGYDPQAGVFSGTNSSGYLRDTSGSTVRLVPRNGDGTFLALSYPGYGPAKIWSNGLIYRIMTTNFSNGIDVYYLDGHGYATISSTGVVGGLLSGQFAGGVFSLAKTFGSSATGAALPAGAHPIWGPASLLVTGEQWRYRGTKDSVDYYGGEKPGGVLTIDSHNAVTYTDPLRNITNAAGYYAGGVFQDLPSVVRPMTEGGVVWTPTPPAGTGPQSVVVDGNAWFYSASESAAAGAAAYVGARRGQALWIDGNQATISDPTSGLYRVGTYANGKLYFPGLAMTVRTGDSSGVPVEPQLGQEVSGDLDVVGNSFSLGTWSPQGGSATNGFGLTFNPPTGQNPGLLQFGSTVVLTDWLWSNAVSDGSADQRPVMKLDQANRLMLFGPDGEAIPKIIFDPMGRSRISGAIRIEPQGDISMGEFIVEPVTP